MLDRDFSATTANKKQLTDVTELNIIEEILLEHIKDINNTFNNFITGFYKPI